jgi:NAD(P)-dependent dehydrogenase (short-subunit alcohol dehydrogenase family)
MAVCPAQWLRQGEKALMTTGRLTGKVALVTGAGGGIGQGIAARFAAEGAKVGVLDVQAAGVQQTVEQITTNGGSAVPLVCDLRDPDQVKGAVAQLRAAFGTISVVVNNAAVMPAGRLHETALEDWDRVFDVNVRGAYLVCREIIPDMIANSGGSIIHMASITGVLGLPGIAAYSATKGALIALTQAMSTDYARYGIRINAVSPGTIDSPMLHDFLAQQRDPAARRAEFDAMHPIGRVGTIEEVASVFVFLASDEASFVTGANYRVDGGMSVKGEQPQD